MSEPVLRRPDVRYQRSYVEGITQLVDEGYLATKLDPVEIEDHFADYVAAILAKADGLGLPVGHSPETERWLIAEGDSYVGTVKIRHRLGNEHLERVGGHLGYYVPRSQRGKGYGTLLLRHALDEARGLGLTRVLVTCAPDNAASRFVIERVGGQLEGTDHHGSAGSHLRYWIELA